MKLGRTFLAVAIGMALVLPTALAGCGGGDSENSEAFIEVLQGLKQAAASNEAYNAVQRAESLDPVEENVVEEFCNNVFQIRANHEVPLARYNRPYISERVTRYALHRHEDDEFAEQVVAAIGRLEDQIDLGSFDGKKLKRYVKACYQ
jgi:hypothetical protein